MKTVTRVGILAMALVLATGLIGATSFTSAQLSRDTNIDVVNDATGVIGLEDALPGDVIAQTNGELTIDFTVGSAQGVNVNSRYELGDPANPVASPGFNITNNDQTSHDITLNYTISGAMPGDGAGHNATEFQVYDSTGTHLVTISEDDAGGTFTLGSGASAHVVVIVDTMDNNIGTGDDLSGTLNVSA